MCGRYTFSDGSELANYDHQFDVTSVATHYNVAPGMFLPVITKKQTTVVEIMKWGYVPFWEKSIKGRAIINARAETVAEKPAFRQSLAKRRCLIPANGFFEWRETANGKQPFYIHLKSRRLFTMAGLYETTHDDEGREVNTYTIITTAPNRLMAAIHDRMPAIVAKSDEATWLDPEISDSKTLIAVLKPYPAEDMVAYEVSPLVNNPRHDSMRIISKKPPLTDRRR